MDLIKSLQLKGIKNRHVLKAIENTPRELFVPKDSIPFAYEDIPLSIDCGQTISQPYVVARMTALLIEKKPRKVLEVGTGSGYQAAILARLVPEVYSIERIKLLYEKAKQRLEALKLTNIELTYGDGYLGWPEKAPFDGIIVTAAAPAVPQALLEQLNDGGRLIIPVGESFSQRLHLIDKFKENYKTQYLDAVRFVPLLGGTLSGKHS